MPSRSYGTSERELLGALVRADGTSVAAALAAPEFDDERFVRFALHHQVGGFVHVALEQAGAALSTSAGRLLSAAFVRGWATNERIAQELRRVQSAFDESDCGFVLLKGLHLACAYYGGSDRRGISDIDLLVRSSDVARAEAVLESLGHARSSHALFGRRVATRFVHAFEFSGLAVPVDLHWKLANHPSYRIDYDALWATSRTGDVDGIPVRVLDDAHALLLAVLGIAKDLELGTIRLKAFVDLHMVSRAFDAPGAWPAFFEARALDGTARTAWTILSLLRTLFETRESLPALESFLARREAISLPVGLMERLLEAERSPADRLWAARLYDASPARVWSWWALSLPFRRSAHATGRRAGQASS